MTDTNDTDVLDQQETEQDSATPAPDTTSENQDDKVTMSEKDRNELISQRDRNYNDAKTANERLDALEAEKSRDDYLDKFLKDNEKKYSYVDTEDLKDAVSPEDVVAIADRIQAKGERIAESERNKITDVPTAPPLSPKDKSLRLKELKKEASAGKDVFGEWLDVEGIV